MGQAREQPLLANRQTAELLSRLLRRRFEGRGGIEVFQTPDAVTICLRKAEHHGGGSGGAGGGGGGWQWAIVTALYPTELRCKLLNAGGAPIGETFAVNLLAATATGLTIAPTLANCTPKIGIDAKVRISQNTGAYNYSKPSTWWLHDLLFETCT